MVISDLWIRRRFLLWQATSSITNSCWAQYRLTAQARQTVRAKSLRDMGVTLTSRDHSKHDQAVRESSWEGSRAAFPYLYVIAALPWPTAEPAHAQQNEQALLPSLNRSLDEDSFHALTVIASGIQRIHNLRPVDAHKVLFRSSFIIKSHDISGKFRSL